MLRAGAGDDLSVAMDFLTAEDHDPRAPAARQPSQDRQVRNTDA